MAAPLLLPAGGDQFVIRHVTPQLPAMQAYIDVLDANGNPVAGLRSADLKATLGAEPVDVTGVKPFANSGDGVAYIFLVDVSKSISGGDFAAMQRAMLKWISNLRPADRVRICSFGNEYSIVSDFQNDKQALGSTLAGLAPRDMSTHLYDAMMRAIDVQHDGGPNFPVLRVLILLSDGKDEGSAVELPDVLKQVQTSHIPVYVIGFSRLPRSQRRRNLDVLRQVSESSGGAYEEVSATTIDGAYQELQGVIARLFIVDLTCAKCAADGNSYPLLITYSRPPQTLRSSMEVTPVRNAVRVAPGSTRVPKPSLNPMMIWLPIIAVLALAAVAYVVRRKKPVKRGADVVLPVQDPTLPPGGNPLYGSSEKGIRLTLAVVAGKELGRVFDLRLTKPLVIGRDTGCDLVLEDTRVSNRHCEIALSQASLILYDLDSKNHTYVNGVPIRGRQRLENEDTLLLGETELRLRFNADEVLAR
ncbi:MAG: FHA domain-containing protein [Bryobacteraceae bacterium]